MKLAYTEEEICKIYRNADEKLDRMKLLHELTQLDKKEIELILEKHGTKAVSREEEKAYKIILREREFQRLFDLGFRDAQIAASTGVSPSTVFNWRDNQSLNPNGKNFNKETYLKLYKQGLTDLEIALEMNIAPYTAGQKRRDFKLSANKKRRTKEEVWGRKSES